jgi:hypothetical protein
VPFSGGRLSGRVLFGEPPAAGVRVVLYWGEDSIDEPLPHLNVRPLAAVDVDSDGRFGFEGLLAASYRLGLLLPAGAGDSQALSVERGGCASIAQEDVSVRSKARREQREGRTSK